MKTKLLDLVDKVIGSIELDIEDSYNYVFKGKDGVILFYVNMDHLYDKHQNYFNDEDIKVAGVEDE